MGIFLIREHPTPPLNPHKTLQAEISPKLLSLIRLVQLFLLARLQCSIHIKGANQSWALSTFVDGVALFAKFQHLVLVKQAERISYSNDGDHWPGFGSWFHGCLHTWVWSAPTGRQQGWRNEDSASHHSLPVWPYVSSPPPRLSCELETVRPALHSDCAGSPSAWYSEDVMYTHTHTRICEYMCVHLSFWKSITPLHLYSSQGDFWKVNQERKERNRFSSPIRKSN